MHPTVLIPCIEYPETDLYLILKHELMHYKQHDIEAKALMFLVQTLYWFNPFVHLMSNKFNEAIEMNCDEYVISGDDVVYRNRYVETILMSKKLLKLKNLKIYQIKLSVFMPNQSPIQSWSKLLSTI